MRMLSAPVKGDSQVVSGESGAVGMGVISSIMLDDVYAELRELLGLGADSQVLLFSTEGDTDPERYRDIVSACLFHFATRHRTTRKNTIPLSEAPCISKAQDTIYIGENSSLTLYIDSPSVKWYS